MLGNSRSLDRSQRRARGWEKLTRRGTVALRPRFLSAVSRDRRENSNSLEGEENRDRRESFAETR